MFFSFFPSKATKPSQKTNNKQMKQTNKNCRQKTLHTALQFRTHFQKYIFNLTTYSKTTANIFTLWSHLWRGKEAVSFNIGTILLYRTFPQLKWEKLLTAGREIVTMIFVKKMSLSGWEYPKLAGFSGSQSW